MKRNSTNTDIDINADGFAIGGGTTPRKLTLSGADVAIVGSGANEYTFPASSGTLALTTDIPTGTSGLVSNEVPGGLINGSNTAFTTTSAFATGSLKVFKNGIRLKAGGADFTEGASGFTMVTAPATGTVLLVDYTTVDSATVVGSTSFIYSELCGGTPNGVLTAFTTASSYVANSTCVFLDGVRMRRGVDYTESADKQITFTTAPATGSEILIDYQSAVSATGNADTLDGQHGSYYATKSEFDGLDSKVGGNGTSYLWLNNILIQWGNTLVSAGATGTSVTFPIAFSSSPNVQTTVTDPSNFYSTSKAISTTATTLIHNYAGGPLYVQWVAIGVRTGKP